LNKFIDLIWNKDGNRNENIYFLLLSLIALVLPFYRELSSYPIALLILFWIVLLIKGGINIKAIFSKPLFWTSILIYLLYLAGLIHSSSLDYGILQLERKLTILLLPIILFSSYHITKQRLLFLLQIFIGACFVASLVCIGNGYINYLESGLISDLTYSRLSMFMHCTFFSIYLNFCIGILILQLNFEKTRSYLIQLGILMFFVLVIALLKSKSGYIGLVISIVLGLGFKVFYQKRFKEVIISIIAIVLLSTSITLLVPDIGTRFQKMNKALSSQAPRNSSTNVRLLIIDSAVELIEQNLWLGVGTGDEMIELNKVFKKNRLSRALRKGMNTHSMYLQVLVGTGIFGLLIFSVSLFVPLFYSFKSYLDIYFIFLSLISTAFLFEVILNMQVGVVFYSFFNTIFAVYISQNKHESTIFTT